MLPSHDEVRDLIRRLRTENEQTAESYRRRARIVESHLREDESDDPNLIQVPILSGVLYRKAATLAKNRPSVEAAPASDDPEAAYDAEVGQRVIEHLSSECAIDQKIHAILLAALCTGTSYAKNIFDPILDANTLSLRTLHDTLLDPSGRMQWALDIDPISEDEAHDLCLEAGVEAPQATDIPTTGNEKRLCVDREELWYRPCRKYPDGIYACVVGNQVLTVEEYPYTIEGETKTESFLPHVPLFYRPNTGKSPVYGTTPAWRGAFLQGQHDRLVTRLDGYTAGTAPKFLLPNTLKDGDTVDPNSSVDVIGFGADEWGVKAAAAIRYVQVPPPPQGLDAQRDYFERRISAVIGLNPDSMSQSAASRSGAAIDSQIEMDALADAFTTKAIEEFVQHVYETLLRLVQLYYDTPRIAKIAGQSIKDAVSFTRADVAGLQLKLQPASSIDQQQSSKRLETERRQTAGLATPTEIQKSSMAPGLGLGERLAEQAIKDFVEGKPPQLNAGDFSLETFDQILEKHQARAVNGANKQLYVTLAQCKRYVHERMENQDQLQPRAPADAQAPAAPTDIATDNLPTEGQ